MRIFYNNHIYIHDHILILFRLKVCSPHYYGIDCNTPCGQCRGDDVCNNVTGHCPHGCKQYWNGTKCDGKKIKTKYDWKNFHGK